MINPDTFIGLVQRLADEEFVQIVGHLNDLAAAADSIVVFYPHWEA